LADARSPPSLDDGVLGSAKLNAILAKTGIQKVIRIILYC